MWHYLRRIFCDERGATAVEYAVMLALILMACIGSVALVGTSTQSSWTNSSNSIQSAMTGGGS